MKFRTDLAGQLNFLNDGVMPYSVRTIPGDVIPCEHRQNEVFEAWKDTTQNLQKYALVSVRVRLVIVMSRVMVQ